MKARSNNNRIVNEIVAIVHQTVSMETVSYCLECFVLCDWLWVRDRRPSQAEADARARAEASRENAAARARGSEAMNDAKHRTFECQKYKPVTWPFRIRSEDKKAACWHHGATICAFCCMDFTIINRLRENKEYLKLCNRDGCESERLSMVESAIADYYECVKRLNQNPANKHSPFMSSLEQSLAEDDNFRRIALAAMHCYDARSSSCTPSLMARETDCIVQTMWNMDFLMIVSSSLARSPS